MSKDPAILFYTSDFITGTLDMSFEDRGKYITLLACLHQKGRMNEESVRNLVGDISTILKSKFKIDKYGLWYNERLEQEIANRRSFVRSRRRNGKLGGRPKKKSLEKFKPAVADELSDEKYPFETFWKLYGKPTEKQGCLLKWKKLDEPEKELIFNHVPAYVKATPDRQFRKNPLAYLRGKIWLDELLPESAKAGKKSALEQLAETGSYE